MRKHKPKNESTGKRESIEEFLSRGGEITKVPPAPLPEDGYASRVVTSNPGASSTLMSLAEGALFYSESKVKAKKLKKPIEKINKDALPASLLKYMPKQDE